MEPETQKADDEEPPWSRIALYAVLGLVFGSALLLAHGGAPPWAEYLSVGFLWFLIGLYYLSLAMAVSVLVIPLPAEFADAEPKRRQHDRLAGLKPERPWRPIKWIARRLLQLAFIAALVIAGRPIMAGLFLALPFAFAAWEVAFRKRCHSASRSDFGRVQWALFLTFGFVLQIFYQASRIVFRLICHAFRLLVLLLKWLVWIPASSAVLAFLVPLDLLIKRRSLKALHLPRILAHLLHRKRYRGFWRDLLPWAFWLFVAMLSLALNFAGLPEHVVKTVLLAIGVPIVAVEFLAFMVLLFGEEEVFVGLRPAPKSLAVRLSLYARRLLAMAVVGGLWLAGQPLLAGLYLSVFLVAIAITAYPKMLLCDEDEPYMEPIKGLVCVALMVAVLIPLTPIWLPIIAYEYWVDFRLGRDLRSLFAMPSAFAYFVYARPDQHQLFLGAEGVLAPFRDLVVARDWRDLLARRRGASRPREFAKSVEGRLVRRFDIRRAREQLPFLAIVVGKRIEAFHLGKAYRVRMRDGGAALGKLEKKIKELVAESFASNAG